MSTTNANLRLVSLIPSARACGDCRACCVSLGVVELDKPPDTSCPYLRRGPGCCAIYDRRPASCAQYKCSWLEGFLDDDMKPSASGVLAESLTTEDLTILLLKEVKSGAVRKNQDAIRRAIRPGVCLFWQDGRTTLLWSHPADKERAELLVADLLSGRVRVVMSDAVIEAVVSRKVQP